MLPSNPSSEVPLTQHSATGSFMRFADQRPGVEISRDRLQAIIFTLSLTAPLSERLVLPANEYGNMTARTPAGTLGRRFW
jgi:hypothetical protein